MYTYTNTSIHMHMYTVVGVVPARNSATTSATYLILLTYIMRG